MELGKTLNNPACFFKSPAVVQVALGCTVTTMVEETMCSQPTWKSTYRNVPFINVTRECFYVISCPEQLLIVLKLDTIPYPVDEIPVLDELDPFFVAPKIIMVE